MLQSRSMPLRQLNLRNQKIKENDLPKRLAKDKRVGLKASVINSLIKNGQKISVMPIQVDYFVARAESWEQYTVPKNIKYLPYSKIIHSKKRI